MKTKTATTSEVVLLIETAGTVGKIVKDFTIHYGETAVKTDAIGIDMVEYESYLQNELKTIGCTLRTFDIYNN